MAFRLFRKARVPRSLLGRMLLLTLLAILLAQTLSSAIWLSQLRTTQLEGLVTSARSLARSMTATVTYLRSLPLAYRPLVLDQMRSMGGNRIAMIFQEPMTSLNPLHTVQKQISEILITHKGLKNRAAR